MQCIARLNDNDLHLLEAFAAGRSFSARVPIVSPDSKTLNPNPVPYLRLAARKCESIYRRIYTELGNTSQWHAFAGALRVLELVSRAGLARLLLAWVLRAGSSAAGPAECEPSAFEINIQSQHMGDW